MNLIEKASALAIPALITGDKTAASTTTTFSTLLPVIINWVGFISVIVAFIFLVISGFLYLTAGGNAEQAKKGLQGILNAVIGMVIIALSWGVLTAVVGLLVNDKTNVAASAASLLIHTRIS